MHKWLHDLRRLQVMSAVLGLVGVADSLYLWWTKVAKTEIVCGVGECDLVNASPYASLLGVPVAAIGAAGYATLIALAVWAWVAQDNAPAWLTDARIGCASIGLFFAAYLTVIEVFVIHAI